MLMVELKILCTKTISALSQVIMRGDEHKYCINRLLFTISCELDEKYMPNSELQARFKKKIEYIINRMY